MPARKAEKRPGRTDSARKIRAPKTPSERAAAGFPPKVDRHVYPRPEYRFPDAKIGLTYKDSVAAESLDVGVDAASPVTRTYADKQPFWFTGEIDQVRFDFGDGTELSPR